MFKLYARNVFPKCQNDIFQVCAKMVLLSTKKPGFGFINKNVFSVGRI